MPLRNTAHALAAAIILIACADVSAPKREALDGGDASKNFSSYIDWYSCASWDGGNRWTCDYTHTTYAGDAVPEDSWDYANNRFKTSSECMTKAQYCEDSFHSNGTPYVNPVYTPMGDLDPPSQGQDLSVPVCDPNKPQTIPQKKAYCAGHDPKDTELTRIQAALDRMRAKGGRCATLAETGYALLANNRMKLFPQSNYQFDGSVPHGGGNSGPYSWMVIGERWARRWYDASHTTVNRDPKEAAVLTLQVILAHELDHLNHEFHIHLQNPDGTYFESRIQTWYTEQCADVKLYP